MNITTPIPSHADTVVLGGGTAGSAVAGRLAAAGDQSVLLVEAGPDYGALDGEQWPTALLDGRVLPDSHDWGYTSAAKSGEPDHGLQRARVIGGCSSHNGCIAIWGSRVDYDGWAEMLGGAAGADWATDNLLPLFHRVARTLRVRRFEDPQVTPFHRACLDAAVRAGVPLVDDLNDLDEDVGVATAPVNMHEGMRWNAALAYLDPVRHQSNLTVVGDTIVDRLRFGRGLVTGVEVIGPDGLSTIEAGRVVLCAGVYGSPAIIVRSGIGPADELKRLGITFVLDMPGVGLNLHDHPTIYLRFSGSDRLDELMDAFVANGNTPYSEQSLAKLRSRHCTRAFDLHLFPYSTAEPDENGRWGCTFPVAYMTPRSRGRLQLRGRDPAAAPLIDTGYLSDADDADLSVLMDGMEQTRRIAAQDPLAQLVGPELAETAQWVGRDDVRRACLHYYHPVGTCRMGGAFDSMGVVNERGAVHGIENLHVADAAIMPVIPRANTNLPTLVIAERIAAWLGA